MYSICLLFLYAVKNHFLELVYFLPMLFITWTNLIVLCELSFKVIHSLLIQLSCLCRLSASHCICHLCVDMWFLNLVEFGLFPFNCDMHSEKNEPVCFLRPSQFGHTLMFSHILILMELLTLSVSLKQLFVFHVALKWEEKSVPC